MTNDIGSNTPAAQREQWFALAIGLVTITGAVLTFLAIRLEGEAAGYDHRSIVETVQVNAKVISVSTAVDADHELVDRFRRLSAEADASSDPEEARWLRDQAALFLTPRAAQFTKGEGADARYQDDEAYLTQWEYNSDQTPPLSQPDATARRADRTHRLAQGMELCVLTMLALVVALTGARLTARPGLRQNLTVGSVVCYGLAVLGACALVTVA